jgi:chemotaxis signal transduction protein
MGAVVDSISEVLAIDDESIEKNYEFNPNNSGSGIYEGIARFKDRPMILIFNFHHTFNISEVENIKDEAQAA